MRTMRLNNGVEMPILGFGTYQVPPDQAEEVVYQALIVGYRHIDTAACYENEEAVGRAIRRSGVPREEVFVTTKLWVQDAAYGAVESAFRRSLGRLGLDYIDLYLIHQPFGDYYAAWRAMEELQRIGRARAIGVSNFHPDRLIDLIEHNGITPAINQIETHVFFQRVDDHQIMREREVAHASWGPLAEGQNAIFNDPTLTAIGAVHNKSVAQVALRWLLQRNIVAVPKTIRPERMRENLDIFDFELSDESMTQIAKMDTMSSLFLDHRDPEIVTAFSRHRIDS